MKKHLAIAFSLILTLPLLASCGSKQSASASKTIKVGVVGENNEQWKPISEMLKKDGYKLELVKFSSYNIPNEALNNGEIDLNAFQHHAFLDKEISNKGYKLTAIGDTIIAPLGLYSKKIHKLSELRDGAKIAIPSDPTNGGRALKVLESAGLIKVRKDAGLSPELSDITENPKNIEFVPVEAAQTYRLLDDLDAAIINGGHAVDHGLNPSKDAIYLESAENNPYINCIAVRTADKDNPVYKKVVEYYHSDAVRKVLEDVYKGAYIPAWK